MPTKTITITGSDATTGSLTLSDNGQTTATAGDKIKWIIAGNSGVANIKAITVESGTGHAGSVDIFSTEPSEKTDLHWEGVIHSDYSSDKFEDYSITWTDDGDGGEHIHDPKILVHPK